MAVGAPDWETKSAVPSSSTIITGEASTSEWEITGTESWEDFYIENTGDTNSLLFQLENWTKWKTLVPGQNFSIKVLGKTVTIKTAADTTTAEVVITKWG